MVLGPSNLVTRTIARIVHRRSNPPAAEADGDVELGREQECHRNDASVEERDVILQSSSDKIPQSGDRRSRMSEKTNLLEEAEDAQRNPSDWTKIMRLPLILFCLYTFVCSLDLLSTSFRLMAGRTASKEAENIMNSSRIWDYSHFKLLLQPQYI